jgi:protein phosphatase
MKRYSIAMPQVIFELGKRENQEDSIFPLPGQATAESRLFLVCDGMGGHAKGEVASATVCQAISEYMQAHVQPGSPFTSDDFGQVLAFAYQELDKEDDGTAYRKMGTTLTMIYFHADGCLAAHIGDSRIYHIRPSRHQIEYRSKDHSLVYALFEAGEITEEEMYTSPQRNVLTRAMMPHQDSPATATICQLTDVLPGDYFFLCSDGMLEKLKDNELLNVVCDEILTDEQKINTLNELTKNNADNRSAYLVHITAIDTEEPVNTSDHKIEDESLPKVEEPSTPVEQPVKVPDEQPKPNKKSKNFFYHILNFFFNKKSEE